MSRMHEVPQKQTKGRKETTKKTARTKERNRSWALKLRNLVEGDDEENVFYIKKTSHQFQRMVV